MYTSCVNRLDSKQRDFLAEFFNKPSLMAVAALVFGQFVPGQVINWWVFAGGAIFVIIVTIFAVKLKKT